MNTNPNIPEMPKVCSTRACSTYDPMQFMSEFQYDNGRREMYLEVKYRVDWFNHWCMEHHVEGNILDQSYEIIPEMRMILATSVVMMNDKEVARAIAGRAIPEDPMGMNVVVQSAFTCAKGRALANLGFGTTNGSTNENGEDIPPDSGIPIVDTQPVPQAPAPVAPVSTAAAPVTAPGLPPVTPDTNPMMMGTGSPAVTEAPKKRGRKPKNSQEVMAITTHPVVNPEAPMQEPVTIQPQVTAPTPQPVLQQPATTYNPQPTPVVSNAEIPQTIEAARAFVCPIGTGKGKTMGELYLSDRGKVEFFAGPKFASGDRHPALVAAAKMLLEQG